MRYEYRLDFGFNPADMAPGGSGPIDMVWGLARSSDGTQWDRYDSRESMEKDHQISVRVFNTAEKGQYAQAFVVGGQIETQRARHALPGQIGWPWSSPASPIVPIIQSGQLSPRMDSVALTMHDLSGKSLFTFNLTNEGHFALLLKVIVKDPETGQTYVFQEDPELVVGGGGNR